jgi:hypothetical protein
VPVVEECEKGARPHCHFRILNGQKS